MEGWIDINKKKIPNYVDDSQCKFMIINLKWVYSATQQLYYASDIYLSPLF